MSAVFDKNGYKVGTQLKGLNFANTSSKNDTHNYYRCLDVLQNKVITLGTSNLSVEANNSVVCDKIQNYTLDMSKTGSIFTCMADTSNNGYPYWKSDVASCDLNQIKNKGYTVYLGDQTITEKTYQTRYLSFPDSSWTYIYTDNTSNFNLQCNSNGNWVMTKTSSSCQGVPSLVNGSKFYFNDNNILYVSGQTGKFFNISTFSQYTGTLTKTLLQTYIATNGTKIEAACNTNYKEWGNGTGQHYYYCDNGTWKVNGGCYAPCLVSHDGKTTIWTLNGKDTVSNSYIRHGSTLGMRCGSGYSAFNTNSLPYCNNGKWVSSTDKVSSFRATCYKKCPFTTVSGNYSCGCSNCSGSCGTPSCNLAETVHGGSASCYGDYKSTNNIFCEDDRVRVNVTGYCNNGRWSISKSQSCQDW